VNKELKTFIEFSLFVEEFQALGTFIRYPLAVISSYFIESTLILVLLKARLVNKTVTIQKTR